MICQRAGKTLPFVFIEYCCGNPWAYEEDYLWKEAVTYTYAQMVQNNPWCKGINIYVGYRITTAAVRELVYQDRSIIGFESGNFNAWTGTSISSGETLSVVNTRAHHDIRSTRFTANGQRNRVRLR